MSAPVSTPDGERNRFEVGGGGNLDAASPFRVLECGGKLFGRSNEVDVLTSALDRLNDQNASSHVIFLRGESGVGKSALFNLFQKTVTLHNRDDIIFASGKFDQLRTSEPYSAIVRCFDVICDGVLRASNREKLCHQIQEGLGNNARLLTRAVPKLSRILGTTNYNIEHIEESVQAFSKFKLLCRSFLRAASTSPLVLFFDDLQWADPSSLEVIKDFMMDSESTNLMIVAAYRDEEGGIIPRIELDIKRVAKLEVTDMSLRNLGVEAINQLLSTMLDTTTEETSQLSQLVLRKTSGNPYFILQFLESLYTEKLLTKSEIGNWTWDIDVVSAETNISDNVLSLLTAKIWRVEDCHQKVLHVASCLGFDFDIRILDQVYNEERRPSVAESISRTDYSPGAEVFAALNVGVEERLLEKRTSTWYRFSHDRVQQCVYEMIGDERGALHAKIGRILLASWKSDEETLGNDDYRETILLLGVVQLNKGSASITDRESKLELVNLNVTAGKIAAWSKTAFNAGANYFRSGISVCGEDLWMEHYSLALELHYGLAQCYRNIGDREGCLSTVNEVVGRAETLRDKIVAYIILIEALEYQEEAGAAIDMCLSTLRLLRHPLPKKPSMFRVIATVLSCMTRIKKLSDDHWLSLPTMTDPLRLAEMEILGMLFALAFMLDGTERLLPLCIVRMIQVTLKHGLSFAAPFAMAGLAMLVSNMEDAEGATRYARLATELNKVPFVGKNWRARTVNLILTFSAHWRTPFNELLPLYISSYRDALMAGDIVSSMHLAMSFVSMQNLACTSLEEKASSCKAAVQIMFDYSNFGWQEHVCAEIQYALNLMGQSENPVILKGEAFDESTVSSEKSTLCFRINSMKQQVCVHLRDWDAALVYTKRYRAAKEKLTCFFGHSHMLAFSALVCHEHYRATKKRKYIAWARHYEKRLLTLSNRRGWAASALLLLLRAESAVSKGDMTGCKEAYDTAIARFRELELWSYEALANDRAALTLLELGDKPSGEAYLLSAREGYLRWGGTVKVDQVDSDILFFLG